MDKNMQQQILKTIEDNLPAQVGNILQERLAKLDRLERENTEEKLKMTEEKIREFKKQIKKCENLKTELDSKELDLKRREDELKLQTEINKVTIGYEQKIAEAIDRIEKRLGTEQGTTNKTTDKWKVKYVKEDSFGKNRDTIHEFIAERTSRGLDEILEDKPVELRWKAQGQQLRFEKTKYGFVASANGSRGHRYEIIITDM